MRTLFYLVIAASIATQVHGRLDPNRPEAKPNRKLSTIENINRTIFDFFLESLGIQAVSESNELFIHNIINELNMNDYCIEIRKMANFAQKVLGRANAFVQPTLFNKRSHAYLYISEEWFDTLSTESKESLIKHELMHIKHNHIGKKVLFNVITALLTEIATQVAISKMETPESIQEYIKLYIKWNLIIGCLAEKPLQSYYSRKLEKEADIKAAETTADKTGFVDLFKDIKAEIEEDAESKFLIKRLFALISKPFEYIGDVLFATHPSLDDRIEYIQDLA